MRDVPGSACRRQRPLFQLFAKAPVPGLAKTRLIPLLGAEGAARLQGALVRQGLRTCGAAARAVGGGVELWCAPDCSHAVFRRCATGHGVSRHSQRGAELGQRMFHALRAGVARASAAILVGTDAPTLTVGDLIAAADALAAGRDAVIVPAHDGGYVLIGLTRVAPALFDGVAWGTPRVFAQTRRRLRDCGYDWLELPARDDLDTPQDWARLLAAQPAWRQRIEPERRSP